MKSINEIFCEIKKYWKNLGYEEWKPAGLLSPYFPTQFNPSATHHQIYEILEGKYKLTFQDREIKKFVIEKVFRVNDIESVGDNSHISLFEMLGVVKFLSSSITISLDDRYSFLVSIFEFLEKLSISRSSLYITYYTGERIKNLDIKDEITFEVLKKLDFNEKQCIPIKGTANFLYPARIGDLAGPRIDIYFDLGNCNLLEIATIDFSYLITDDDGKLKVNESFSMMGFYTSVERLTLVSNGALDIWDIPPFDSLLLYIDTSMFGENITSKMKCLLKSEKKKLMDRVRSILFILSEGQKVDSTSRGRILRNLIKDLLRLILDLYGEVDFKLIRELFEKMCEIYKERYNLYPKEAEQEVQKYIQKLSKEEDQK